MQTFHLSKGHTHVGMWLVALTLVLGAGSPARASQLTIPGVSATDGLVTGNVVALPQDPVTSLFHNPAHLSLLPNSFSSGVFTIRFQPSYENKHGIFLPDSPGGALPPGEDPEGVRAVSGFRPSPERTGRYDSTSREFPMAPNMGYVTDRFAPFSFGIGMYGSLGFSFNHDAAPEHGVPNNFFTELVSVSLAPSVSYSLAHNLHVGVGINPTYGRLKTKTPTPLGRLDLDVRGPGVFGTIGVLYQPTPKLNLGLAYKTPGKIWMFGNARVGGGGDDATVYFNIPQNVKFGFAYRVTERWRIVGQARWSHLSVFDETRIRFDKHTALNSPAVGRAKDRWRVGAGMLFEVCDWLTLGTGFSYEPWAIKDDSLRPTLSDNTDILWSFGGQITRGAWIIDLVGGLPISVEDRYADASENPFTPGRYELEMTVAGFQMTRLLGSAAPDA